MGLAGDNKKPSPSAPATAKATAADDANPTTTNSTTNNNNNDKHHGILDDEYDEYMPGIFRGIATALRKFVIAKGPAMKQTIRSVGQNRPLAFASEGAVAGDALLPRFIYYGAWGLSGVAITADIYTKQMDAPTGQEWNTVLYWTTFHIPASLVVPALIIHQIVHKTEAIVHNPIGIARTWSPRMKSIAPVGAALLSIVPVVPIVDHIAEWIMEPTLGKYLGLEFDHHHHGHGQANDDHQREKTE